MPPAGSRPKSESSKAALSSKAKAKVKTDVEPPSQSLEQPEPSPNPFPFYELPSELRLRIYELILVVPGRTLDLDPSNYFQIRPRLSLFLVSRRMHEEAYHVFYGTSAQPVRLFPIHGRFFHTKKPLLARLSPQYRSTINTAEMRLGPGWSAPPKCWNTEEKLGLTDCVSLRTLKIFVEIDPSDDFFGGFRGRGNTQESYKLLCLSWLRDVVDQVPSLQAVELDAWPGVAKDAPLVTALARQIEKAGKRLVWGPLRGWQEQGNGFGMLGIEDVMAAMSCI